MENKGSCVVGNQTLTWGKRLLPMTDSTDLYKANDFVALRQRLATDGFLFIRGLIPRETAISARRTILEHIQQKGAIRSGTKLMDAQMADNASAHAGWTVDAESGGVVGNRDPDKDPHIGWSVVGNSKEVTAVYNGEALNGFYSKLFAKAEDVRALPHCTWLRAKGKGEVTAEHADYYYFRGNTDIFAQNRADAGSGSSEAAAEDEAVSLCQVCGESKDEDKTLICDLCDRGFHMYCMNPKLKSVPAGEWHCDACCNADFDMYTCWISMSEIKVENGTLAVCPGTQTLTGYQRPINKLLPRQYENIEKKAVWQTTNYGYGDIVLFNIKTVHAATKNTTMQFRISCDTRVCGSRFTPDLDAVAAAARTARASTSGEQFEEEDDCGDASMGGMSSMGGMGGMGGMGMAAVKKPASGMMAMNIPRAKGKQAKPLSLAAAAAAASPREEIKVAKAEPELAEAAGVGAGAGAAAGEMVAVVSKAPEKEAKGAGAASRKRKDPPLSVADGTLKGLKVRRLR